MNRGWRVGLMLAVLYSGTAGADMITLKSGKQVEGVITQATESGIQVRDGDSRYRIRYSQIREIHPSSTGGAENSSWLEQAGAYLTAAQARVRPRRRAAPASAPAKKKIAIYYAPSPGGEAPVAWGPPVSGEHRVEIYTTSWCPYCKKMRAYLNTRGVSYEDYDIEKDAQARVRHRQYGATGVPLLVVDGKSLGSGFSAEKIEAALFR